MRTLPMGRISLMLAALFATACDNRPDLNPDAAHWDVKVTGFIDTCNDPGVSSSDDFTYSLTFDGSATDLAIGWDTFANGAISGCFLTYGSPLVGEDRAGGFVQWKLSGEAYWRQGGDACSLMDRAGDYDDYYDELDFDTDWDQRADVDISEADWIGVETFRIENSEDPALSIGCTYTSLVVGSYAGSG